MKIQLLALFLLLSAFSIVSAQQVADRTPNISLYESTERVKLFLKQETKKDYSDKYLSGVSLQYVESHPKKGLAWVHIYNNKKASFGGERSVYHYLDGEIIELQHGP